MVILLWKIKEMVTMLVKLKEVTLIILIFLLSIYNIGCLPNSNEEVAEVQDTWSKNPVLYQWVVDNLNGNRFAGISTDECDEVNRCIDAAVNAYSNSQPIIAHNELYGITNLLSKMKRDKYDLLDKRLYGILNDNFMAINMSLRSFSSLTMYDNYLATNMELALFLGRVRLLRNEASYTELPLIEALVLHKLRQYKERYLEDRESEFEGCTNKYIEQWIRQIESDDGFVRNCMRKELILQKGVISEKDSLMRHVIYKHAEVLLYRGRYLPIWLQDEFACSNIYFYVDSKTGEIRIKCNEDK